MKWIGYILIMTCLWSCLGQGPKLTHENFAYTVFKQGDHDYACYRIPAIIRSADGQLLAFAEARKNGCTDNGDVDIVLRKSKDEGKTWGDMSIVWSDSTNTCGNPAPVIDAKTGHIHLLTTWNHGSDSEQQIIDGTSIDDRRVFVIRSNDHGESWSYPREITSEVKPSNWSWYATGPGSGHQVLQGTHKGRLIIGCDHITKEDKNYYSHAIYSDDNGITWRLGGTSPQDQVNECEVAELSNGDLIMNMRNYDTSDKTRQVALSKDGGVTWTNQKHDPSLVDPICQASLHTHLMEESQAIFFSNPASLEERKNMTVRVSFDDCSSWAQSLQIGSSKAAYSDLVSVTPNQLGILYEGGINSPYEQIVYTKLFLGKD